MVADKLSRKLPTAVDIAEAKAEKDIDDFIFVELNSLRILSIFLDDLTLSLVNNCSDNSQKIATYLTTLRRPLKMDTKKFNTFKKKTINSKVQDNQLFC